ncbi:MAG: hypothetical protein DWQ45_00250 [Planctomycetota bacterium]|nr:MAG: hypothetical protein DWQ29_24515 [Planctomycetota bacterium]REK21467.1 MAG: hypothetical protein DWQ41_21795 [Planctomycetota bacterium]REK40021.1 MAG: hypothetical protein DWQ45_00250 [Planctomycetota bacterium]
MYVYLTTVIVALAATCAYKWGDWKGDGLKVACGRWHIYLFVCFCLPFYSPLLLFRLWLGSLIRWVDRLVTTGKHRGK